MKLKQLLILLILPGFFLTGCYQEVDLSVPFEGSKMVLDGYLTPQKGLDLWIKKTFDPYEHSEFGEHGYFVTHARVNIWQDGALIDSCREIEKGHYRSFHPEKYEANAAYEVRITASEFPEVKVRDIHIPEESLVEPDLFSFRLEKDKKSAYLEVSFQNPDHYTVYEGKAYYDNHEINEVSMGPIYVDNPGPSCDADAIFISNRCKAGKLFKSEYFIDLYKSTPGVWEEEFLPKEYVYFEVGQIDPRYKNYIEESDASDEPFIEPSLDAGNAEGGYGFILGWNTASFTYRL